MISLRLAKAALAIVALLAPTASADRSQGDLRRLEEERSAYAQRLRSLLFARPKDEYLNIYKDGDRYGRSVALWVKAGPIHQKDTTWARRLTVYVDDTSGHRARSVPDQLRVEVKPPARLVGAEQRRTTNGETSLEIVYGPGQKVAAVRISTAPWEYSCEAELPVDSVPAQLMRPERNSLSRARREPGRVDERLAAEVQDEFDKARAAGKRDSASAALFILGRMSLDAGQLDRAIATFTRCETEYSDARWAPLCVWGQMEALRQSGKEALARQKATLLVQKYPESIPAHFAVKPPGEIWIVPVL
jgi:hypothetical protein